jgi:hypothetical protein
MFQETKKGYAINGDTLTIWYNNGARPWGYIVTDDLFDHLILDVQRKIDRVKRVSERSPPGDLRRFWQGMRDEYFDRIDLIEEARITWCKVQGLPYKDDRSFSCNK